MTQWVENPTGGRDRGPQAIVRAWVEVMVRPKRFFTVGVAPGDQAPGLVFAIFVALIEVSSRIAFGGVFVGDSLSSKLFALIVVGLFIAPAALHLTAALQTVILMAFVPDRAGISETVQVIAYAVAPCLLAGLPFLEVRVACTLYGAILLAVGTSEVHGTSLVRAVVVTAIPSALVFGYGFRGFDALATVFPSLAGVVPW